MLKDKSHGENEEENEGNKRLLSLVLEVKQHYTKYYPKIMLKRSDRVWYLE